MKNSLIVRNGGPTGGTNSPCGNNGNHGKKGR